MTKGYLLADTNSLVYAYKAGGTNLIDLYMEIAIEQDREFAITDRVLREIEDGPLKKELSEYIADRQVTVLPAPDTEQKLRTGQIARTSSGEVSMLEVAAREQDAGRVTRIWSDDQYFDSNQIMRHHNDAHRSMSKELLDEAFEEKFITAADHKRFSIGYDTQPVFQDSPRLRASRYDYSVSDIDTPHSPHVRGIVGGIAVEAAMTAYEWNGTRERAQVFSNTLHNETAAVDTVARQAAQTAGMVVGTIAASATATALNVGSGGTAALVLGEGYLFGKAAEQGVELWQKHRVYNVESEGVKWTFSGTQWIREDMRADLLDDGQNIARQQDFAALPDKARELSAQASVIAVEQALAAVPTPRDPFVQAAGDGGDQWTYQPDRGAWTREVVTAYDINNNPSAKETVEAGAEQAAQLSAQVQRTIDQNLAAGPAEIAAQYQTGHKAHGYDQTPAGGMPPAVATALNPDLLQASDGKHYQRDAQGEWAHDSQTATAQRALELELTRDRLLPALQDHQQQLASMPPWQPPTPEQQDKAFLREAYLNRGIDRDTRPEDFDASYLAVQRTRAETGATTITLVLGQDASGQFTPNSPIHHLHRDADGVVKIAATTTPEDIAKALTDVRARSRGEDTPHQSSPERTIAEATPEEHDAREQSYRERERAEQGHSNRTLSSESMPTRETPEPVIAPRTVGLTASGGRDGDDRNEPQHAAPAEAQPAALAATAPDPALAHRAATRDERDDERESTADPDRTQAASTEPAQPAPLLMTQPAHPAHGMYTQALSQIERSDVVPACLLTHEEKSKLAAGAVAQFLSDDFKATRVDGLYASTHNARDMPAALIPVQGDPTTDYCRRASIDVTQALQTPLEQSSTVAQTMVQAHEQALALEQAQEQARKEQQEQDGTKGPTMRMGTRTQSPSMGPQGDGGGDGSGGE